jgi:hypothetical protein
MAKDTDWRGLDAVREAPERLAEGLDPFAGLDVPSPLDESLARHRRHLAELVQRMKRAGISEQQIEASVSALVEVYKGELLAAIRRLKDGAW